MSDCKKCGNPYDHHRFPQRVDYCYDDDAVTATVRESLLITCRRCGYSWEEPTKDQGCT